jgi:beta-glucosidase
MSDWGGTYDGVGVTLAGQDIEMPTGRFTNRETLLPAIRAGKVSRDSIIEAVRRQLRLADRFGWSAQPPADLSVPRLNPAGRAVAYRGALEAAVLLKNSNAVLPIDPKRVKTVAVIGPNAHPSPSTAGGSGHVPTFEERSLLAALSHKLGPDIRVTYAPGLAPPAIMNRLTRFATDSGATQRGVAVEVFENDSLSGEPQARRVEPQFATSAGDSAGALSIFDWLPPDEARALMDSFMNAPRERKFERWTGWYTPAAAGTHTLSVQADGKYRLFVDDQLVLDSTSVPQAGLRQAKQTFSAQPHKIVFEQGASYDFGRPNWRVNVTRDGTFVQPVAKQLAAQADVAIVAVGFDAQSEGEGADREFALPPGQDELIREIAAANPNTVVVVTAGGAVDVRPWLDNVAALLTSWYPGQEGGAAMADLLVGAASPSGRLPISWERAPEDNPTSGNYYYNDPAEPGRIVYREGIFLGYRGYQHGGRKPQFPFGFGLGYTSFAYSNLTVQPVQPAAADGGPLYTVSFDVLNTGTRAGADVAQVYVGETRSRVARPVRELKGFARTELKPGETRRVSIPLDARSFAYYDVAGRAWRADPGAYRVEVGQSAENIVASTVVRLPRKLLPRK